MRNKKQHRKQLRINNRLKHTLYANICFYPCYYCKYVFLIHNLTIEHIIPLFLGGMNDSNNISLACRPCNHEKGKRDWALKRGIIRDKETN